jgi:hypothetical protein
MQWCSGSARIVVYGLILWNKNYFSSCGMYELVKHMIYEFIYTMNSVRIHIFFAL